MAVWRFKKQDDADRTEPESREPEQELSTTRLERALANRDWPAAREIMTGTTPEKFMSYIAWAAQAKGVEEWIPDVIRAEPDSTLPLLVRGARMVYWAWEARGGGRADTVGPEQWKVWFHRLKIAEDCLNEVVERDPGCAEAWHYLVILGRARQLPLDESWRRFNRLIEIDPTHLYGHQQMLNNLMPKWSGSTESMFGFARTRAAAHPGSDLPLLVVEAHLEHRWAEGGNKYLRRNEVAGEIFAAAHSSFWHEDYRRSLTTATLWNHFAYSLTIGKYYREACAIFDLIGEDEIRSAPWRSTERFLELRERARDRADDPVLA